MNIGKVFTGLTKVFVGKSSAKVLPKAENLIQREYRNVHLTNCFTDSASGIRKYEGTCIDRNGRDMKIMIESFKQDGKNVRRIQLFNDISPNSPCITRTKASTVEDAGSIWGGKKITVETKDTIIGCRGIDTKLVKEYNPAGQLEHKELTWNKNVGNEDFTTIKAIQDREYDEVPLNHSTSEMLKSPKEHRKYKHSLSVQTTHSYNRYNNSPRTQDNYSYFANGSETNYSRTVKAREDAIIAAKKKAEAEALAAKEAAEKAAAELKAKLPRLNTVKLFGIDAADMVIKEEKLANGTIKRTFTEKGSDKVLIETFDRGIKHEERIYGSKKADFILMTQVGKNQPYILAKKGEYTQLSYLQIEPYKKHITRQYSYDGIHSCEYSKEGLGGRIDAEIKVPYKQHPDYIESSAAWKRLVDRQYKTFKDQYAYEYIGYDGRRVPLNSMSNDTRSRFPEVFKAAQENWIDFNDLLKGYTA